VNFLNIEYFLVAAEELNFTRAAARLYISPQSLSMHISRLEEELDVELFNRTHPMTLTYAGKALVRRARELIDIKKQITQELHDIKDFKRGVLTVGISPTRGKVILPLVLPAYHEKFPEIELRLLEGSTDQLISAIQKGDIDLMISLMPFTVESIESVRLYVDEIRMVVPDSVLKKQFPQNFESVKARLSRNVDLSILRDCPFLAMGKGNRVRAITDKLFSDHGITPNIVIETENIETLMELCHRGMGITFYPSTFIAGMSEEELAGINTYLISQEDTRRVIGVGYMKNRYLTRAAEEFIKMLKEKIPY